MYTIKYTKDAIKDVEKIKAARLADKVKNLIAVLEENPYQNPPRYEPLKENLSGLYSHRINIQHQLVYAVL